MAKEKTKYKRVLLKLSGEVFQSKDKGLSVDPEIVDGIANRIKGIAETGVEIAIVNGGGNIFRGLSGETRGINRNTGDYMGMLATIINSLALQNALEKAGLDTRVMSAIEVNKIAEPFILRRALRHLGKGRILVFSGGTGNPYFSTDTTAALRASEIGADVILKATKVDGVYSEDPMENPDAELYTDLSYKKALSQSLKVMDATAFSLCMENNIPIIVFNFFKEGSLEKVIEGEKVGTTVS